MPKWTIALIAASLAGITGFALGALLTRVDRTIAGQIENHLKEAQETESQLKQELAILKTRLVKTKKNNSALKKQVEKLQSQKNITKQNKKIKSNTSKPNDKIAENKKNQTDFWSQEAITKRREVRELKIKKKNQMDSIVRDLIDEGTVHSIDVKSKWRGKIRINPLIWATFSLETKQNLVRFFSNYSDYKGGIGSIDILSSRNDTKLASFGFWNGVEIFQ